MKYTTMSALLGAVICAGSASAATIAWDFEDGNTTVDGNDSGLTVGTWTTAFPTGGGSNIAGVRANAAGAGTSGTLGAGNRARLGVRTGGANTMSFAVTVGAVGFDFTTIAFEQGLDESGSNTLTPSYTFTVNDGTSDIFSTTGNIPQHNSGLDVFYSGDQSIDLSGDADLQGVTNETLTFTWAFSSPENRNSSIGVRAHTLDDITLTTTPIPEPSSTALLGLGGLALILRRRK